MGVKQVEDKSQLAYRIFVDTCRSPATRDIYTRALSFFMSYLKISPGSYDKLLDNDPKHIQMDICDFMEIETSSQYFKPKSTKTYVGRINPQTRSKWYKRTDSKMPRGNP